MVRRLKSRHSALPRGNKLLLINKRNKPVSVKIPADFANGAATFVDESTGDDAPHTATISGDTTTLAPFSVMVVKAPSDISNANRAGLGDNVQRVCFTLRVKQERIDEYRRRHAAVWPAMLAALSETGWHNYSLFLAADGLLVGYLETDDFKSGSGANEADRGEQTLAG